MRVRRLALFVLCVAALAPVSSAAAARATAVPSIFSVAGYQAPGTPQRYDRVMIRRYGSPSARKVLVLVPGTFGGAGDFSLVGPYLAAHVPGLQVWAETRREGALEDDGMLIKGLLGQATVQQVFDYYLGWLANPAITPHYQPLQADKFGYVDQWGLAVAMNDLHAVIVKARAGGRHTVILGGHSLGGSEASIYPAWDFNGRPGYKDIAGIVGIDGLSLLPRSALSTAAQAKAELAKLQTAGPWADLLPTVPLPWSTGAFADLGALAALKAPHAPSVEQAFPLLPALLKPAFPATNAGILGYGFDTVASNPANGLSLIQVHSGHLATSGAVRDWVDAGPTPIENVARAFSTEPLGPVDWYYPTRLSIDVGAADLLTETPAARVLGLRLSHLSQVNVPLYAIQTALGGTNNGLRIAATALKRASRIPSVTFVDKRASYGHLDPLLAAPAHNAFLQTVVPWLERIPVR